MKTNKKMMLLSFIGIIIVVLGHTGDGISLFSNIFPYYSFHMTLFIFISGYFYNTRYENNVWGWYGYIFKKVKKMLVPYYLWNLFYGVILLICKKMNIVSYGADISLSSFFIKPWITGHQYIFNLAAWFVLALFLVNIVYIVLRWSLNKVRLWNDDVFTVLFFILSLFAVYLSDKVSNQLYLPVLRTSFFMFFYHFGYMYKTKYENKFKINNVLYFIILLCVQLFILKFETKISYVAVFMQFNNKYLITPVIVSLTGIFFWLKISEILIPSLENSKIINYISNHTYDIMQHHLFIVFLLNLLLSKLPDFNLTQFKSTIYYTYTSGIIQYQVIYTILSIAIPLIIRFIYEKIKNKIYEAVE